MRAACRALVDRLRIHCESAGVKPPIRYLRRLASLRWVESQWYVRDKLTPERADLLETMAYRIGLDRLERGTPLCGPDLPDCVHGDNDLSVLAPWPDGPLMLGMRDMVD